MTKTYLQSGSLQFLVQPRVDWSSQNVQWGEAHGVSHGQPHHCPVWRRARGGSERGRDNTQDDDARETRLRIKQTKRIREAETMLNGFLLVVWCGYIKTESKYPSLDIEQVPAPARLLGL